MKSVMLAIRPQWCEKICHKIGKDENGKPIYEKRIEVRKSAPSEVPFKAYIYATKPKKFCKCGAMSTSDELLWLANGKVEMGDGFKFWADGDEYQCLNGRIIGEFICDKVYNIEPIFSFYGCYSGYDDTSDCSYFEGYSIDDERLEETCLTQQDLCIYGNGNRLYGWHISDLKIYDKPKKLSEFISSKPKNKFRAHGDNLTRPPQSWIYVEEQK